MRVLVLGSNSFLGASFISHLLTSGQHDVIATSRSEQASAVFLPYRWTGLNGIQFIQIDLNHDMDRLAAILREERPTHIANFAAQSMVAESWETPDHWMQTNVVALTRLVDLLRRHDRLERYLHVTTPEVYGSLDGWTHEDAEFNPTTPYAVSRAAGDMLLATYVRQYGFPVVFVRPANIYGPGQRPYRIITKTILTMARKQKLIMDGDGLSERAFLHASDNADAMFRVLKCGGLGECYHISGYETTTIRGLIEKILERLFLIPPLTKESAEQRESAFARWIAKGPERPGLDKAYKLDSTKIRTELGWRDKISLDEGIADVIQWSRQFASELADVPLTYQHRP